jgi:hypothetical protein
MEYKSNFIDNLRLLLKGKYVVSDKDLKFLSDTIFSFGLEDIAENGILFNLYFFMKENNFKFPISYNHFKTLWEKEYLNTSFNLVLKDFIDKKLISLRRVSSNTFKTSSNITKNPQELEEDEEKFLVLYGTELYNEFMETLDYNNLLKTTYKDLGKIKISESISIKNLENKYTSLITDIIKLAKTKLSLTIELESYNYDNIKNTIEFNFLCGIPKLNENSLTNKDFMKLFKKNLKSNDILDREIYIDGKESLFIGIVLDMRVLNKDIKIISQGIFYTLDEILDKISVGGR